MSLVGCYLSPGILGRLPIAILVSGVGCLFSLDLVVERPVTCLGPGMDYLLPPGRWDGLSVSRMDLGISYLSLIWTQG